LIRSPVAVQIASDLFEYKEKARSILVVEQPSVRNWLRAISLARSKNQALDQSTKRSGLNNMSDTSPT
jgi:hypothetical protein